MEKDSMYARAIDGDTSAISRLRMYACNLTTDERTILHIESIDGNPEHVKFILREFEGENLLVKLDSRKETALHLAAFYGNTQVVCLVIDAARNLSGPDDDPHNPITCFEDFVRHANLSSNTALHVAVSKGNLAIAKLLAEADPGDTHIQNCNGDTPVSLAARLGYNDIVMMICTTCTHPSLDGPHGTTALHAAIIKLTEAKKKDCNVIEAIVVAAKRLPCPEDSPYSSSIEAFFDRTTNDKDTAIYLAVRGNLVDVVRLILEVDPGYQGIYEGVDKKRDLKTLIYMAAEQGYMYKDMVTLLCETYETDNNFGHKGQTALHAAIMMRNRALLCSILEDAERLVTYSDDVGWTPLHYAAFYDFDEVLEVILTTQVSIGYQPVYGEVVPSPLFIAAKQGHISTVLTLLRLLPDESYENVDDEGRKILHLAIQQNNKEMICAILEHYYISENPHKILKCKDVNGDTPLHILFREGCYLPELMIPMAGDTRTRNNQNWVPCDMLYFQDEIVGDQLKIKKKIDDMRARRRTIANVYSAVPPSKRSIKNTEFEILDKKLMKEEIERYKNRTNTQIIVTALITTVTFTVGFTMPGGYHQSGESDQGLVLLSDKVAFNAFMVSDALALVLSISSLFLYFISSMYQDDPHLLSNLNAASTGLNIVSVLAMMLTFITGTYVVLSHSPALAITVCVISCFFFILVIGLTIKLIYDRQPESDKLQQKFERDVLHRGSPMYWIWKHLLRFLHLDTSY